MTNEDMANANEIDYYLTIVEEYMGIPKQELVKIFNQVSADYKALVEYLETDNENLLWTAEEDKILQNLGQQT